MNAWRTALGIVIVVVLAQGTPAQAADYTIDATHSQVLFKVKHLGISTVTGRFEKFAGLYSFDPEEVEKASVSATVDVYSLDTNVADRDEHLRSPDFFDAANHPEMTFVSRSVKDLRSNMLEVAGDLTLRGVTRPVTLRVEYHGTVQDPWGNERSAFTATAAIDRREFGIQWNKVLDAGGLVVGNEVQILLEVEGIRK